LRERERERRGRRKQNNGLNNKKRVEKSKRENKLELKTS
jgi:hypothetical protein